MWLNQWNSEDCEDRCSEEKDSLTTPAIRKEGEHETAAWREEEEAFSKDPPSPQKPL